MSRRCSSVLFSISSLVKVVAVVVLSEAALESDVVDELEDAKDDDDEEEEKWLLLSIGPIGEEARRVKVESDDQVCVWVCSPWS